MVSWLAHAISGVVTNPAGTAWYDRYGLENSDKCQGTYGQTYTTPNGAQANMRLGARDYVIQQNWVNAADTTRAALTMDARLACATAHPRFMRTAL